MARLKPVSHEDRLTVVEHLDELRTRILVSLSAFGVAFASLLLAEPSATALAEQAAASGSEPITLGVAEAFTTTVTVGAYAALVLALPVLLYQLYAYVLPAFTPTERRRRRPLLLMIPVLFLGGVAFGYFLVSGGDQVPPATSTPTSSTPRSARAITTSFVTTTLLALRGRLPGAGRDAGLTRLGITTRGATAQEPPLRLLICAVVAAALPGVDPVSMLLEMVPLVVLFELSILLAKAFGRPSRRSCRSVGFRRRFVTQPMLFDLQGKRRRVVQATYLILAVLMGGGLCCSESAPAASRAGCSTRSRATTRTEARPTRRQQADQADKKA